MAKAKLSEIKNDSIFGTAPTPKETTKVTPIKQKDAGGRPKTIPSDWKTKQYTLDPKVYKAFGAHCMTNELSPSKIVNELIENYMKENS